MTIRNLSLSCVCMLGIVVTGPGPDAVAGDFDGNGLADLAIGVPRERIGDQHSVGAVHVLYSSGTGLDDDGNQYWTQGEGLAGSDGDEDDHFGQALAAGDFDGDGLFDLAAGVPQDTVDSVDRAGAVHVIYGAKHDGLVTTGNQYWNLNVPGTASSAEGSDDYGSALAAGDFNGDGYDDLAIGVTGKDMIPAGSTGAVHVLHGSAAGLQAGDDVLWSQDMAGSAAAVHDSFGQVLASGDFDNDGYDDLAIGVPHDNVQDVPDAGAVNILYGDPGGLVARAGNHFWHQNRADIPEEAEISDNFGASLATGDFNGDGHDDLAIGVPREGVGADPIREAGFVHVMYGSPIGLDATDTGYFHQDSPHIGSIAEGYDSFGRALGAGDFNGDGFDDLAIGVPHEDWNQTDTGIVQVVWGSSTGLAGPDQLLREDLLDNFGLDEENDRFGSALAAGDFDGDGYDELAINTPSQDLLGVSDCGVVHVLPGTPGGLSSDNQWWYQGKDDLLGSFGHMHRFGSSLVAIPGPIALFDDSFESGNTNMWSRTVP